jgi:uncharacterized membrane protein
VTKTRLEAFSDGVFAIATTLLVIEVKVPEAEAGRLAHELWQQWPSYAAYLVSFLTIGIVWINHHTQFERIAFVDWPLLFINLVILMVVAFIPFPTALIAEYLRGGEDQHVAAAVYCATMLAMGAAFGVLWQYVSRRDGLLAQALTSQQRARIARRTAVGFVGYSVALAAAFVSAPVSLAICALIPLYYALAPRGAEPAAPPT